MPVSYLAETKGGEAITDLVVPEFRPTRGLSADIEREFKFATTTRLIKPHLDLRYSDCITHQDFFFDDRDIPDVVEMAFGVRYGSRQDCMDYVHRARVRRTFADRDLTRAASHSLDFKTSRSELDPSSRLEVEQQRSLRWGRALIDFATWAGLPEDRYPERGKIIGRAGEQG